MTTLAAYQGDGWSVIGCDSRASDEGGRPMTIATHKITENNGYLIAGSGASRGSNILQFGWKPPKPTKLEDLDLFMTQKFIPAMRKVFIDAGYDMKEDGDAAAQDSDFIISIHGLFILSLKIILGTVISVVFIMVGAVAMLLWELWRLYILIKRKLQSKRKK